METIISAIMMSAIKLFELIAVGLRARELTREEIEAEIKRIESEENDLIKRWRRIADE